MVQCFEDDLGVVGIAQSDLHDLHSMHQRSVHVLKPSRRRPGLVEPHINLLLEPLASSHQTMGLIWRRRVIVWCADRPEVSISVLRQWPDLVPVLWELLIDDIGAVLGQRLELVCRAVSTMRSHSPKGSNQHLQSRHPLLTINDV